MGIRFRRRLRIAPGLYVNLSGSGASVSVGPRGASLTLGKRGVHANLGIPGTGLYMRERIDLPTDSGTRASGQERRRSGPDPDDVDARINAEGTLELRDSNGQPVSEALARRVRRERRAELRALMQAHAEDGNALLDAIQGIHLRTPPPEHAFDAEPEPFAHRQPQAPEPVTLSWWQRLFSPGRQREVAVENARRHATYRKGMEAWRELKVRHERAEAARLEDLRSGLLEHDIPTMEARLGAHLEDLDWPRETTASFELAGDGSRRLLMDVDLPEIEHLPTARLQVPGRGWTLRSEPLNQKEQRLSYARHIHGVLFRLTGEAFAALPSVQRVVLAGYSQRPSRQTGRTEDEYLLSLVADRDAWSAIDFDRLEAIDPVRALERFDLRRDMSTTGMLRPITPHSA